MAFVSRRTAILESVGSLAACAMFSSANRVNAVPPEGFTEPFGLVWFIGTVEQVVDGTPMIDLGEVHTLRRGSTVAAIRYSDSQFAPLGVLEVRASHPTWCQTEKPRSFAPEVGDLVMFVESPGDLGSGDKLRDNFIRHQIVAGSNRNRYSTMRDSIEADTLQRVIAKQPTWVEGDRRIAGVIRSNSVPTEMYTRMKPFMKQIMLFQDYEDRGVNIAMVTSEPWQAVLQELRRKVVSTEADAKSGEPDSAAEPIVTENKVDPGQLLTVRRVVDQTMFQRFPEERNVMAAICATLLHTKSSNERQWIGLQLAQSQFPALSRQEQTLIDVEAIMRRVRKTE